MDYIMGPWKGDGVLGFGSGENGKSIAKWVFGLEKTIGI